MRAQMQQFWRTMFVLAATVAFVMAVLPHPTRLPGEPSDKVLHILAFLVLGSLASLGWPRQSALRLVAGLTALGALIEAVQAIPVLHRDSDVMDLVADTVAALVAVWITRKLTPRQPH